MHPEVHRGRAPGRPGLAARIFHQQPEHLRLARRPVPWHGGGVDVGAPLGRVDVDRGRRPIAEPELAFFDHLRLDHLGCRRRRRRHGNRQARGGARRDVRGQGVAPVGEPRLVARRLLVGPPAGGAREVDAQVDRIGPARGPGLDAGVRDFHGDGLRLVDRPRPGDAADVIARRPVGGDGDGIARRRHRAVADRVAGGDGKAIGRARRQAHHGGVGRATRRGRRDPAGGGDNLIDVDVRPTVEAGRRPADRGRRPPGILRGDVQRGRGNRVLPVIRQPEVARVRGPRVAPGPLPAPGVDRRPGAGGVHAEMQVRPGAAPGVPALRDDLAAGNRLTGAHVDLRQVRVAGAEPVVMIDDDGLAEARIDRVGTRQGDAPVGGGQHVLIRQAVIPAVVAVVVQIVAAARRHRVAAGKARVDAVAPLRHRAVEAADPVVDAVVRIAVVEDGIDRMPGDVRAGQEFEPTGTGRGQRRAGHGRRVERPACLEVCRGRLLRHDGVAGPRAGTEDDVLRPDVAGLRGRDHPAGRHRRRRAGGRGGGCLGRYQDCDDGSRGNGHDVCAHWTLPIRCYSVGATLEMTR